MSLPACRDGLVTGSVATDGPEAAAAPSLAVVSVRTEAGTSALAGSVAGAAVALLLPPLAVADAAAAFEGDGSGSIGAEAAVSAVCEAGWAAGEAATLAFPLRVPFCGAPGVCAVLAVSPVGQFRPFREPVAPGGEFGSAPPAPVPVVVPVPAVTGRLAFAAAAPLVELAVSLVELEASPVEAAPPLFEPAVSLAELLAAWAALSEPVGACGATLLCGWLTGGLVVVVALVVASSKAANCVPSEFCAGGAASGRWDEAMAKWARTSDAELGTMNLCGRKPAR